MCQGDPESTSLSIRVYRREPPLALRDGFDRQPGVAVPAITHVLTNQAMRELHEGLTVHLLALCEAPAHLPAALAKQLADHYVSGG